MCVWGGGEGEEEGRGSVTVRPTGCIVVQDSRFKVSVESNLAPMLTVQDCRRLLGVTYLDDPPLCLPSAERTCDCKGIPESFTTKGRLRFKGICPQGTTVYRFCC